MQRIKHVHVACAAATYAMALLLCQLDGAKLEDRAPRTVTAWSQV